MGRHIMLLVLGVLMFQRGISLEVHAPHVGKS